MDARHLFIAAISACSVVAAHAVDMAVVPLPTPVTDRTLSYGGRSMTLPEGQWSVVSRAEGSITQDVIMHVRPHTTVYAADVNNGRLRAGVVLRMAEASVPVRYWKEKPCEDVQGEIYKEELSPQPHFPECVAVWKRKGHLYGSMSAFYAQAAQWMDGAKIGHKGGFYELYYSRNAANDFGSIRVFVPVSTFASDADAVAWARQLPGALQRLFERRDTTGALPPLPAPVKP